MKDRMFDEMSALLNQEQLDVLRPGELKGRTSLDMFSTGVVWNQFARPIRARDANDFASSLSQRLSGDLKLDTAQAETLRGIVARAASALPAETWNGVPDPLSSNNMMPIAAVRQAAGRHMAMLREIERSIQLTQEQQKVLRGSMAVPVPIQR